jgi:hypothetical protein
MKKRKSIAPGVHNYTGYVTILPGLIQGYYHLLIGVRRE